MAGVRDGVMDASMGSERTRVAGAGDADVDVDAG